MWDVGKMIVDESIGDWETTAHLSPVISILQRTLSIRVHLNQIRTASIHTISALDSKSQFSFIKIKNGEKQLIEKHEIGGNWGKWSWDLLSEELNKGGWDTGF